MTARNITIAALCLLLSAACGNESASDPTQSGAGGKADSPSDSSDWRQRVAEDIATLRRIDPERLELLRSLLPMRTRAGHKRFATDAIHDPFAASVFLARLDEDVENVATRYALVEALPRTGGEFVDALDDLMKTETSGLVRAAIVAGARRGDSEQAHAVLGAGLSDPDPNVRLEAAITIGRRADGDELAAALTGALGDADPATRAAAAHSLGVLKVASARADLADRLDDGDDEVRRQADRALRRIGNNKATPN